MPQPPVQTAEPAQTPEGYGHKGGADTPPAESPRQLLEAMKAQLAEDEASNESRDKDLEAERADVTALQTAWDDIATVVGAYDKGLEGLQERRDDLGEYAREKRPSVDGAIGAKKGQLDAIIGQVDGMIANLRNALQGYEEAVTARELEHAQAEKAAAAAQAAFDAAKDRGADVDAELTALDAVRAALDTAEDEKKPARMYVYLNELEVRLGRVAAQLVDTSKYRTLLVGAWRELAQRKQMLRAAAKALADATYAVEKTRAALTALETGRSDEILDRWDSLPPTREGPSTGYPPYQGYPPQQGYPPPQQGYPPPQQGYPPPQQGYPPPQQGYPPPQQGYPPPQQGYPPPQQGYPPQGTPPTQGYPPEGPPPEGAPPQGTPPPGYPPPPQQGYPPPQQGYPPPQQGYPPPQQGYPPPQGYPTPPQQGYPESGGGQEYPEGQPDQGYPQQSSEQSYPEEPTGQDYPARPARGAGSSKRPSGGRRRGQAGRGGASDSS